MTWLPISREDAESMYMDESADEQIAALEQYLQEYCNRIRDLSSDREAYTQTEILVFSLLDSLGFIVGPSRPNGGGQRVRFFVEEFCACEELERYSVPALLSALLQCDDQSLCDLRDRCQYVFRQHWVPESLVSIDRDLEKAEIIELVRGQENVKIAIRDGAAIELEKFKHSRMLAGKRNAITHQLVKRGYRLATKASAPFYVWRYDPSFRSLPEDWDLAYPAPFLLTLCEKGIAATTAFLRDKKMKPYQILLPATAWLGN
jgi:hypothetical protein